MSLRALYPVSSQALYPVSSQAPYPVSSQALYPVSLRALYPVSSQALYPVSSQAPYPVSSQALYPVSLRALYPCHCERSIRVIASEARQSRRRKSRRRFASNDSLNASGYPSGPRYSDIIDYVDQRIVGQIETLTRTQFVIASALSRVIPSEARQSRRWKSRRRFALPNDKLDTSGWASVSCHF